MKVITIESSAFTALTEQIAEIAVYVRAVSGERKGESSDMLLTTREAAHLLNVSTRTLQRMRSEQRIGYIVLRGKCRYRRSEIDRLLADCTVAEDAATLTELNEHYHSVKGARTESQHIFIDMGLKASATARPHILEIGFGTGLNALLTLETAEKEKRPVHYTGIELYPLAWPEVDALKYSDNPLFEELHRAAWEEEVAITPYFTLRKVRADVETISIDSLLMINKSPFDVVYFDAFAPEKQPGMWEEKVFRNIHAAMSTDGVLTTYCAKGVVRRMLQAVGFKVERLPGPPGGKREILRGRKEEVING